MHQCGRFRVHTTTSQNADENGDFRKRFQKWSDASQSMRRLVSTCDKKTTLFMPSSYL